VGVVAHLDLDANPSDHGCYGLFGDVADGEVWGCEMRKVKILGQECRVFIGRYGKMVLAHTTLPAGKSSVPVYGAADIREDTEHGVDTAFKLAEDRLHIQVSDIERYHMALKSDINRGLRVIGFCMWGIALALIFELAVLLVANKPISVWGW
jgi:hypothetical protein